MELSKENAEFYQKELIESISTFRTQFTLLTQAMTVLAIGNFTILGYALANKNIIALLIGSFFPAAILYSNKMTNKYMLPIIYTAISLENKLKRNSADGLITSFVSNIYSYKFIEEVLEISLIKDQKSRMKSLEKLNLKKRPPHRLEWICFASSLLQIIAALTLLLVSSWKMY